MAEPGSHQTPEPWATTWEPQTSGGGYPWGSCAFSPQMSLQTWPGAPPWHHLAQRPTDILAIQGESWAETEREEGIQGSELGRRRACGLYRGRGGQVTDQSLGTETFTHAVVPGNEATPRGDKRALLARESLPT